MSQKEVDRHHIIKRRLNGEIEGKAAAKLLKISTRHLRRLAGGFKKEGVKALIHKNRGRECKTPPCTPLGCTEGGILRGKIHRPRPICVLYIPMINSHRHRQKS